MHVVPVDDEAAAEVAVGVARDVRVACGLLPTQVVVAEAADLPGGDGLTRRLLA